MIFEVRRKNIINEPSILARPLVANTEHNIDDWATRSTSRWKNRLRGIATEIVLAPMAVITFAECIIKLALSIITLVALPFEMGLFGKQQSETWSYQLVTGADNALFLGALLTVRLITNILNGILFPSWTKASNPQAWQDFQRDQMDVSTLLYDQYSDTCDAAEGRFLVTDENKKVTCSLDRELTKHMVENREVLRNCAPIGKGNQNGQVEVKQGDFISQLEELKKAHPGEKVCLILPFEKEDIDLTAANNGASGSEAHFLRSSNLYRNITETIQGNDENNPGVPLLYSDSVQVFRRYSEDSGYDYTKPWSVDVISYPRGCTNITSCLKHALGGAASKGALHIVIAPPGLPGREEHAIHTVLYDDEYKAYFENVVVTCPKQTDLPTYLQRTQDRSAS